MPTDRDPLDLDERTARLGRRWFAQVRQQERDEAAAEKHQRVKAEDADGDTGLFDWLFGDGDADADDGGD